MTSTGTASASPAHRTITVPGLGSVRVEPDVADLRLGVVSIRPTAAAARLAAAETTQALLAALLAAGVEWRDLRTALVGLDAVRDYSSPSGPTVTGYQMTNTVEATVRVIDTVGGAVDATLAAGATSMDGLAFRVADPTAALAEARRLAVADARGRAMTLAAEAGVTLGPVEAIREGGALAPGPPHPVAEFRMKATGDASTPVEAGTSELTIPVTVTFLIA